MTTPSRVGPKAAPGPEVLEITKTLPPRRTRVGKVTHLKERILRETTITGLASKIGMRPEKLLKILSIDAKRIEEADYNLICDGMGWNPITIMAVETGTDT